MTDINALSDEIAKLVLEKVLAKLEDELPKLSPIPFHPDEYVTKRQLRDRFKWSRDFVDDLPIVWTKEATGPHRVFYKYVHAALVDIHTRAGYDPEQSKQGVHTRAAKNSLDSKYEIRQEVRDMLEL